MTPVVKVVCLLGVKQQSCEAPIVFISFFALSLFIIPFKSIAAHRTLLLKVVKFSTKTDHRDYCHAPFADYFILWHHLKWQSDFV